MVELKEEFKKQREKRRKLAKSTEKLKKVAFTLYDNLKAYQMSIPLTR